MSPGKGRGRNTPLEIVENAMPKRRSWHLEGKERKHEGEMDCSRSFLRSTWMARRRRGLCCSRAVVGLFKWPNSRCRVPELFSAGTFRRRLTSKWLVSDHSGWTRVCHSSFRAREWRTGQGAEIRADEGCSGQKPRGEISCSSDSGFVEINLDLFEKRPGAPLLRLRNQKRDGGTVGNDVERDREVGVVVENFCVL